MRLSKDGVVQFFYVDTGEIIQTDKLLENLDVNTNSWTHVDYEKNIIGLGLDTGQVLIFRHEYKLKYGDDYRTVIPSITYPYGEQPINLQIGKQSIES
nr:phosphate ABC transporter permease [Nitrosopumilaceae archaeon]